MFPLIAHAQYVTGQFSGFYIDSVLKAISGWVNMLVPLLIGLAVVVFFYGLVKYIWGGAEAKASAISSMVWGVVAIAVMVSIWGLVGLLQGMAGVTGDQSAGLNIDPAIPTVTSTP